eukprot:TRINITY_DN9264_c0_g1_i1.p1 TRINITY_DN9264_c0_g1~~TRINITY_DN9264_c0_g1_i1.p1  ORF type:complete len:125 (-),score=45.74 TRINITY_DN9264_c0_g1_i1:47-400(-)
MCIRDRSEEAWALFNRRKYSDCITAFDDVLDYAQTSSNDKLALEARTYRSFAHLYNGSPDKSLQDALASIDANPSWAVSYTHLRAHETVLDLVCRLLLEKKKTTKKLEIYLSIQKKK